MKLMISSFFIRYRPSRTRARSRPEWIWSNIRFFPIAEAEGIVRVELRVNRNKVRYEKEKSDYESEIEYLMNTAEISERFLNKYLRECFGTGCFLKASKAEEIIRESSYKDKTKESMCRIIRDTAKNGLQKASVRYEKNHKSFYDMIGRFNSLGISPITIEQRSEIECLDHPIEYIKNRNANLPKQRRKIMD